MNLYQAKNLAVENPSILAERPELESAACLLPGEDLIFDSLIGMKKKYDASMARQIRSVTQEFGKFGMGKPPEVFLFTAYSAIPFADAFRGYFGASGQRLPVLGYINVSSRRNKYSEDREKNRQQETERLKAFLGNAEHVCVVEEYVDTGSTLALASDILQYAGIVCATAIRGKWDPVGSSKDHVDVGRMTSIFAQHMHELGQAALLLQKDS
jgi:hypothetical protein